MPPRKRGRPAVASNPEPEPEQEEEEQNNTDPEEEEEAEQDNSLLQNDPREQDQQQQIRFFNTTFSTFRVSPLYTGKQPLTKPGLEILSKNLRDTLVGDVVRGVQVGLVGEGDATLGRAGALERVQWRECDLGLLFPSLASADYDNDEDNNTNTGKRKRKANRKQKREKRRLLCLELEYENVTFSALMLPSLDDGSASRGNGIPSWTGAGKEEEDDDDNHGKDFTHLPLLLTRMPAPLKTVLVNFLQSTFDCRISPLHLGTRTMIRSWERWIQDEGAGRVLSKDVALTLGFHVKEDDRNGSRVGNGTVQLGLKTMDVIIRPEDVGRFLRAGQSFTANSNEKADTETQRERERERRRKLSGGRDEEGWGWREEEEEEQPFTEALAKYLDHHLALDVFHPGVRVLRVVCGAFALAEGRVKVFGRAGDGDANVDLFVRDLVRCAMGRVWGEEALRLASLVQEGEGV